MFFEKMMKTQNRKPTKLEMELFRLSFENEFDKDKKVIK